MRVRMFAALVMGTVTTVTAPVRGDVPLLPPGGAAITPDFSRKLFDQIAPLRESDGCVLERLDTGRFHMTVELRDAGGVSHEVLVSTGPLPATQARSIGGWTLSSGRDVTRECGATLARVEEILSATESPAAAPWRADRWVSVRENYTLLAFCFVLLGPWTVRILWREYRLSEPPGSAVAALVAISLCGLFLRQWLSPQTFLHEYYHVAGTLASHLRGQAGPVYGDSGPALYQLVATLFGRPGDARVIFMTNAVVASLAIPAVALFDLALFGLWSRALCAALLLAVLPQHLRFSASEVLFVPALTMSLCALTLAVLYLRTRRLEDASCAAVTFVVAMQTRPEMHFLPILLLALVVFTQPRVLRAIFDWRTLVAFALFLFLFVPRFIELAQILQSDKVPTHNLPSADRMWHSMVLFQADITPPLYWIALTLGGLWLLVRKPGVLLWATATCLGLCAFSLASGDNPPYNVRSQFLPNAFTILVAAGVAPLWMALAGPLGRLRARVGFAFLVLAAVVMVGKSRGFITAVGDQQQEWEFLQRAVSRLPERGRLLTNTAVGRNLDAFPELLLHRQGKVYEMIDLSQVHRGDVAWPEPGEDLFYYQGMFCHCDFHDAPVPDPMTAPCEDVYRRYRVVPFEAEHLPGPGFSALRYAPSPFRVGFFRLSTFLSAD